MRSTRKLSFVFDAGVVEVRGAEGALSPERMKPGALRDATSQLATVDRIFR